jgi:hypothetical protein
MTNTERAFAEAQEKSYYATIEWIAKKLLGTYPTDEDYDYFYNRIGELTIEFNEDAKYLVNTREIRARIVTLWRLLREKKF